MENLSRRKKKFSQKENNSVYKKNSHGKRKIFITEQEKIYLFKRKYK